MNAMSFAVGEYTCRVLLPEVRPGAVSHVTVEWDPYMPKELTDAERQQYRDGLMLVLGENHGRH